MKAKIYPLKKKVNEINSVASSFCLHLEIICASLAKGTSVIKNVTYSQNIATTINWCQRFGATFKKTNDKLIVKGVNHKLKFSDPMFESETTITAKLLIPLFSTILQPFGIKTNQKISDMMKKYKDIFDAFNIIYYEEDGKVRFEKMMKAKKDVSIDGSTDIYLVAGLLLAFPLLDDDSSIRLIAPISEEKSYHTIEKIMRKFSVEVKHPSTMQYSVNGNQHYRKAHIKTEMDKFFLAHQALLTLKLKPNDDGIVINNYRHGSTTDNSKLFDFASKNVIVYRRYQRKMKYKDLQLSKIKYEVKNSIPYLMVLGVLNGNESTIITNINADNLQQLRQIDIMKNAFSKLGLQCNLLNNELVVHAGKIKEKKQVDSGSDAFVVMALSFLALCSDVPIVIRNVNCVYHQYDEFFNYLKSYGAEIEFIHD